MHIAEIRFAKSGDVHIAHQVVGDGPLDLVWISNLEIHGEHELKGVPDRWRL